MDTYSKNIRIEKDEIRQLTIVARIIAAEKSEILSAWTANIKAFGGRYEQVSLSELQELCAEFIEAFIETLHKKSFLKLRLFIEKLSHIRSAQGFRLSEVQRAYYSFFNVIKPFIERLDSDDTQRVIIVNRLHSILVDTLFELSESYHQRLNEKIDEHIKKVEKANMQLKEISIKDDLTSCYNHKYFQDTLEIELSRANRYKRPLALIMFDIDHFKRINDTYGHLAGDNVLRGIGILLRRSIRPCDKAFRYGGEEFSIILPETDIKKAFVCAERIRKEVSLSPFSTGNKPIKVTVSAGVDDLDKDLLDKKLLIDRADAALYMAKRKGRNMVLAYESSDKTNGS